MSRFAVIALCIQACLIQTVFSNSGCGQSYDNYGYNLGGINAGSNSALSSVGAGSCAQYGGSGTGQVGVAGDIGACGNTVVVGSVPVIGSVDFNGCVPAAGTLCISGQCGCGRN